MVNPKLDKLIHPVWIKMYGLDRLEGEIISLPARKLLNQGRFDLFAKLFYIRHRHDKSRLARRVYFESLRSIIPSGKEFGKEKEKNSFKIHVEVFDKLIDSFKVTDFDPSESLVPVARDCIIDGAHRIAALAFWGKDVIVCKFDCRPRIIFGYSFFLGRWMSTYAADLVVRESLNWLQGVSAICVMPGGNANAINPNDALYSRSLKLSRHSLSRLCSMIGVDTCICVSKMIDIPVRLIFTLGQIPSN